MPALLCRPHVSLDGCVSDFIVETFMKICMKKVKKLVKLDINVGHHTWRLMHVHIVEKYEMFHT
jgi:hypothetical protein